jgi:hypothetical protein
LLNILEIDRQKKRMGAKTGGVKAIFDTLFQELFEW